MPLTTYASVWDLQVEQSLVCQLRITKKRASLPCVNLDHKYTVCFCLFCLPFQHFCLRDLWHDLFFNNFYAFLYRFLHFNLYVPVVQVISNIETIFPKLSVSLQFSVQIGIGPQCQRLKLAAFIFLANTNATAFKAENTRPPQTSFSCASRFGKCCNPPHISLSLIICG